jgi:hypothetical protein
MSYDFMMFKPVGELRSPDDLSEETTAVIGSVAEIREALSRLYPAIDWSPDEGRGVIFGSLDGPDTWYEFYPRASRCTRLFGRTNAGSSPRFAANSASSPSMAKSTPCCVAKING